ncbi:MAG: peptidylprolyl isomerase [Firmicutes bacterium]|nr:peptidylprolyl isomerase [Bacillota bacterium]
MSSSMRRRSVGFAGLAATVGLGLILAGCGTTTPSAVPDPASNTSTSGGGAAIVATYNGGTVTQAQLNTQVHLDQLFNTNLSATTAVETQILKQYILVDRLIKPKAIQAGVTVPDAKVQQAVLQIKQQYIQSSYGGDTSKFAQKMQTLGLTDGDIAAAVKDQMLISAYAPKLVKTLPLSQLQQYYNQNIEHYTLVTERAILVKKLPLAQTIAQKLRNNGSWDKLALQYSQDPGSSKNGGEYVNQDPSNWVPAFAQHAMSQPLNVVGDPFYATPYGYFVMEVLKRTVQPFASVKSSIAQQLEQTQEQAAVNSLVTSLQKAGNIKILLK